MATHKSAIKRIRQNKKRRTRNRHFRTNMRTCIKNVRLAIEGKDSEKAAAVLKETIPVIDKAAGKGLIHKRNASRKISRLTRLVNSLE